MTSAWQPLLNPVFLIVVLILVSIFFLILAAIRGWDKGSVLLSMAKIEFARGLITYLFAVVTIGTAVVLLVFVLTTPETGQTDQRFEHGKEILSLLLGVFGAIVGFYFGSEVSRGKEDRTIRIAPLKLTGIPAIAGKTITVSTVVSGGRAPWRYCVVFGDAPAHPSEHADSTGWLVKDVVVPATDKEVTMRLRVVVRDEDNQMKEQSTNVVVLPREKSAEQAA